MEVVRLTNQKHLYITRRQNTGYLVATSQRLSSSSSASEDSEKTLSMTLHLNTIPVTRVAWGYNLTPQEEHLPPYSWGTERRL